MSAAGPTIQTTTMSEPTEGFHRELRLFDATMIVIGSMIGSGIFIVTGDIARTVGSGGWVLMVWAITGVMTLLGALSYGELAGMMPKAGGQYVFLREAYNPLIGFLYGWTLFAVIQTGTIAAVAVAFAKFTGILLPWFSEQHILFGFAGHTFSAAQLLAIVMIVFLSSLNSRGLKEGKAVQNTFTFTKTAALVGLILLGILVGRNAGAIQANWTGFWEGTRTTVGQAGTFTREGVTGLAMLAAIGVAMVGSLFSSDAWNNITFTAGEVVEPRRTIPMSLALGTLIVTVLYILANIAYLLVLPLAGNPAAPDVVGRGIQFATSDRVATAAVSTIFGQAAEVIMAVFIMVSTFGCNNGLILAGARVYYAMAKDGLFFGRAGVLNTKAVPGFALGIQAVWASLLCLSGTYGDLLDYVMFAVLLFYALTVAGIFILRTTRPDAERPYKALGYPALPALYIAAAVAFAVNLLVLKPGNTWPGLIIVLLGIPLYYLWGRKAGDRKTSLPLS
jgi:APA family basic amino acid/polyamine antiporter